MASVGTAGDESTIATTTGATGATGPTGAAGQVQAIEVSETDFALDPKDVDVEAGAVEITAVNSCDSTVHSLAVEDPVTQRLWGRMLPLDAPRS